MVNFDIFDRQLLLYNRNRYRGLSEDYNFLYLKCANIILENIEIQNRDFDNIFEINSRSNFFRDFFAQKNFNSCNFEEICNEESIDFGENKYDLIINNFDIHFINNVPKFFKIIKKSLRPKGLFIASFIGDENLPELRKSMFYAENEIYKGSSSRLPPTIDIKSSARLLANAGFKNSIADLEKITIDYESPLNLLKDIKYSGQGNIMKVRSRKFFTKKLLKKLFEEYQKFYNPHSKAFPATFSIITLSGEA